MLQYPRLVTELRKSLYRPEDRRLLNFCIENSKFLPCKLFVQYPRLVTELRKSLQKRLLHAGANTSDILTQVCVHTSVKKDLLWWQERPSVVARETYCRRKRGLLWWQERPSVVAKET